MTDVNQFDHLRTHLDFISRAIEWTSENWSQLLVAFIVGLAVYLLLESTRSLVLGLCRRRVDTHGAAFFIILRRAVARTSHLFLALVAIRLVVTFIDPPAMLASSVRFLFTIGAVIQSALWLRELILGFVDLRADPDAGGSETLANASGLIRALLNGALIALALVVVLDNLGVNVTGLVAGLGIGGIAIGLAAQGIFSDLFASLSILFDQPFKIGETISIDGNAATVERIGLKTTRLRAITGETRILSNAQLLSKDIISYAGLERRRFTYPIGLIYQTAPEDCARVPELLREIVESEGGTFVRAGFTGFGASSLDFEVQFDVMNANYDEIYATRHRIGIALLQRFNALGLCFAYPTQTTFTADPNGQMIMPYPSSWPPAAQS